VVSFFTIIIGGMQGLELRAVCLVIADNDDLMIQKYRQKYRHIPFATPSKIIFKGGGWSSISS
jgi:hypothetical protein